MTYGFKFNNDNNKLVIDDSNVKPWYISSNTGSSNSFGLNYKNVDQSGDYLKWQAFNPIFNAGWRIYELRYVAPNNADCFFAYTLPDSTNTNISYCTQEEGPISLASSTKTEYVDVLGATYPYVSIFAMVPISWLNTATQQQIAAAVPKVYFFANNAVPNSFLGTDYGMQVFDAYAKCMYDSNKLHIQLKSFSFQDWNIPVPQNSTLGGTMESYFTAIQTATSADNTAFVIPAVVTKYYYLTYRESPSPGDYGAFDIYKQFVQRFSTSAISIKNVNTTTDLTTNLGLGQTLPGVASGTWWNYGTGTDGGGFTGSGYKIRALAIDAAPLDRGYTASQFPSSYSLTVNKTNVTEGTSNSLTTNAVTFTLTTTNIVAGTQFPYTITGTNITANDISLVERNSSYASLGALTGYFTIGSSNVGTITLYIAEDYVAEGNETLTLTLNNGLATATVTLSEDNKAYALSFISTPDSTVNGIPQFRETGGNNNSGITFQVKTKNVVPGTVLNWEIVYSGTSFDSSDIVTENTSVPLTIQARTPAIAQADNNFNGIASTSFILRADNLTEGTERGRIRLTESPSVYLDFDILDTSLSAPSVSIYNPSSTTSGAVYLNEGQEYVWVVIASNIPNPNGVLLYPKLVSGTATAADIAIKDYGTNTADCVILNESGVGVFSITPTADVAREGLENFTLGVYYPQNTKLSDYNGTIYINDTSRPAEVYTTDVSSQYTNEGQILSVTITSRYDYAHPIYWVFAGIGLGSVAGPMSLDDIASMRYENLDYLTTGGPQYTNITKSDRGSFSFPTSGTQTDYLRYRIQFTILSDSLTENAEFGAIDFYGNGYPPNGGSMLVTQGFFIQDVPVPTYTITPSATTLNEGDTLVWTITTTNVPNGTVLWWLEVGSTTNSDYYDNLYGTSVTINNNTGTVSRQLKLDLGAYEGTETSVLWLYSDSSYTNRIAQYSGSVSIADTSNNINEVLTLSPSSVVYPNPTTVYITGGVPNTEVKFSLDNTSYSGSVTLDASGNYTNTAAGPGEVVGSHTLYVKFTATGHTRQASWTVTAPAPTYSFARDISVTDEGTTITYTVTTTNVTNGTRIYWTNYGTTDANDFTSFTNEGFVTINNNTGSFYRTLRNDVTTEGQETIWIFFYADSGYNTVLGYTGQTTVNDTSVAASYNESITVSPTSVTYPNPVTVNITGGQPSTTVAYSLDTTNYDGTVTLDSSGNYTNTNAGPAAAVGSHTLYVRFSNGHTRQASWTVTAANPAAGTLLSTFCSGTTKYGTYANGSGGSYNQIIATNSTECGYTPPGGLVVSGYSSTTNDTGNVDVEGSPSAAYDGLRCRGMGRDNIDSYVTRTFTVSQAATITAYLEVNSELNYDFGEIYFDNVMYARGSGNYNSGALTGPISAGTHTIKVRYTKDGSVSGTLDKVFGYWSIT